jgi:hypothetical protein
MSNLYRGPSIDAFYQVSYHLAPQAILVSDWSISKNLLLWSSLAKWTENVLGSIYGRSSMRIAHSIFQSETSRLWRPCLLTDRNEISSLYRGPSIEASYQVSVHLAKKHGRHRRLVSDWLISKKSSPVKPLCHMNRNLVGSIYGRFSIKIAHFVLIH